MLVSVLKWWWSPEGLLFVSSAISLIENGLSKFSFNQMTAFTIPSLNKTLVLELSRCEFLSRKENLLLLGNSGTGKTHIALALGLSACQRGHRQV
jgi:DNA replication protein DnaC